MVPDGSPPWRGAPWPAVRVGHPGARTTDGHGAVRVTYGCVGYAAVGSPGALFPPL